MKKIYLLSLLVMLIGHFTVKSQNFVWAKRWGTVGNTMADGWEGLPDKFGNVYMIQRAEGVQDLDYGAGVANSGTVGVTSTFIMRYSASGNYKWGFSLPGTVQYQANLIPDAHGNIYVAGHYAGTVDFDPGAGTTALTATVGTCFIAKYDSNMVFKWVKEFRFISPVSGTDYGWFNDFALGNDDKLYYSLYWRGTVDFNPGAANFTVTATPGNPDASIIKLDSAGNYMWSIQTNGGGWEEILDMAVDNNNNKLLISGYYIQGTNLFGTVLNSTSGSRDVFYASINPANGVPYFVKGFGGTGQDYAYAIEPTSTGQILISGQYETTVDFNPGAGTNTATVNSFWDPYIARYDANGNFVWVKPFTGLGYDGIVDMDIDGNDNIWLVCASNYYIDADPGIGVVSLGSGTQGVTSAMPIKLDSAAKYISSFAIVGTTTLTSARPWSLNCSPLDNSIYLAGLLKGSIDFDPGAGATFLTAVSTATGTWRDSYFAKYLGCAGTATQPGTISGNTTVCATSIQTYSIAPVSGATSYIWILPSGWTGSSTSTTISATVGASSGTIGVYATNACGTSPIKTLSVTVSPVPTQPTAINGPVTICNASPGNYSVAPVAGATSYTWSLPGGWTGSSSTNTILGTPGSSGIMTITASNACGVSPQQTLNITVNAAPSVSVSGNNAICKGSSNNLTASGATTYTWNTGANGANIAVSPTVTTTYTVTGTAGGCTNTAVKTVTVNAIPSVTINSNPTTICSGGTATMTATSSTAAISNYLWSTSATSSLITTNIAGVYSATITDINGCVGSQSFTLGTSTSLSLTASSSLPVFCTGNTATLSVTGATNYTWSTGGTGASIVVSPTTNTTYSVYGTNSTCNGTTNISITINSNPTVTASGNPTTVCSGALVNLTSNGANTYTWSTGATTQNTTANPVSTTVYTVTGSNAAGCTDKQTVTIGVFPNPTVTANTSNSLICSQPIQQTATLTSGGATTYTWSTGANGTQIAVSPSVTTSYTVIGTDNNGCTNSIVFTQSVSTCAGVKELGIGGSEFGVYPNPTKGSFTVLDPGLSGKTLEVFNALGEKIYSLKLENEKTEVDLHTYANGVYFVKVGTVTKKIIKQ